MTAPRSPDDSFAALFEHSNSSASLRRHIHAGESLEVTVVAVGHDAIFADLGGKQEGIFERPDLSDAEGRVRVEVGSRITAVVAAVDSVTGQVRLRPVAIRAEGDTHATALPASTTALPGAPALAEGARVKGQVTGVERYGVFVQIAGTHGRNGRGLVPSQETGTSRGADLKKHFAIGQEVEAKILNIDETGRIRLSISALGMDDERGMFEAYKSGSDPASTTQTPAPAAKTGKAPAKPAPRNFGTLGDLLPKIAPKPKIAAPAAKVPAAKGAPSKAPAAKAQPAKDSPQVSPSNRSRPPRGR